MSGHILPLTNKIALVTGASRGIGKGIATKLSTLGAMCYGTATTAEGAQKITDYFISHNLKGRGLQLNVTQPESIERAIKEIKEESGSIGILINNAAITKDNLFLRLKEDEWFQVIETNLNAIYRLSKSCIKDMVKARWGRIVSIGSVVGSTGNKGQANYCASKAGIIGFSKSLAQEVGSRGITVNVVAPGFIATDMTNALTEEQKEAIFEKIPMGRVGEVEEIAATVAFLVSDGAAYITGQTIHVNGGLYMN